MKCSGSLSLLQHWTGPRLSDVDSFNTSICGGANQGIQQGFQTKLAKEDSARPPPASTLLSSLDHNHFHF
jgi:hypothetical protein